MSENIRGITFAEQPVTPADDAIVRRAVLGDGILTGCAITYSGSTLTMASGFIIACGRAFQITAAQNWAVVDATSGVARLLLTIDLTRTATENTFDQISFNLEYAAAEDGFVDIVQEDINLSGTKYQIVAAVVSLGTGGITGIVSKLEKTEGGGGGLNFKVVPGLTQPGAATENTIWVKTEKMTGWVFSVTEPAEPAEGMVWITTGTSSAIAFNALKKNAIQVYPISAKQYIGGAWVDVTALSYQGGEWVEWKTYLYNAGAFASGQSLVNGSTGTSGISYTENEDSINIVASNPQGYTYRYFEKPVDLTDKSVVKMTLHSNAAFTESGTGSYNIGASIWADSDTTGDWTSPNTKLKSLAANTDYEVSVDVSALSGEYYIWLKFSFTNTSSGKLDIDILSVEVE